MKAQIATSPSQSQRLLACGVDPKTADMCWSDHFHFNLTGKILQLKKIQYSDENPAWSTSRLLSLLPKSIKDDNDTYAEVHRYGLLIYPFMDGWQVEYQYCEDDECHCLVCVYGTTPIEACVKAIEWLTKEGYKLNQIE